jgi:hypothetical protein
MDYSNYILDFERINELTVHPNDNPNSQGPMGTVTFCYHINRKFIREYVDVFTGYRGVGHMHNTVTDEVFQKACAILHYNGILISPADIRDGKIVRILKE